MDFHERTNSEYSQPQAWDRQRQGAFISPTSSESHPRHGPETLCVSVVYQYCICLKACFVFSENENECSNYFAYKRFSKPLSGDIVPCLLELKEIPRKHREF